MAEFNKKGQRLVSFIRILEYHGTDQWLEATVKASRLPMQGKFQPVENDPDTYINCGVVEWNVLNEGGIENPPATPKPIPIPPGPSKVM